MFLQNEQNEKGNETKPFTPDICKIKVKKKSTHYQPITDGAECIHTLLDT